MRKLVAIIVGVIIIACVLCGVAFYMYNMSKVRTSSKPKSTTAPSLESIVLSSLNTINGTHYTEISRGLVKLVVHVAKIGKSQGMSMYITMFLNDVKSGLLRNGSVITYYGYVKNVTTRMEMIANGGLHKALLQFINVRYLEKVNVNNGSAVYCISGKIILKSDNYYNETEINKCIKMPSFVVMMFQHTSNLNMMLIRTLLPLLIRNIKYLGEMSINGQRCYMYEINSTIDIAKLLTNKTLLNELAKAISNSSISSQKISAEKIVTLARKVGMVLALTGLAEWKVQSKFCITPTGYMPYLYAKITNMAKTMYNITIIIMSKVVEKVETGKINVELLKSLETLTTRKATYLSPEVAYSVYLPQASQNPLLMTVTAMEAGYFMAALHSVRAVSVSNVTRASTSIISPRSCKISVNSNMLRIELKNDLSSPISTIIIMLVNENTKKLNKIEIICNPPLAENSTLILTCMKGSPCKVSIMGAGRCIASGRYLGASVGAHYMAFIFIKLENGSKVISPPLKIEVTR